MAADRVCPKCEADDVLVRWHKDASREAGCGWYAKIRVHEEHLHVRCNFCFYEWAEDTMDNLGASRG